ncbi:nucleoside phosphorylase [Bulleidia sp. zg-1006]|uniref:nucleoside phosphorylase n=1 Tax=Bulleidia sp. zg-1006 TaxID=2806552 RepID=UPI001939F27E|nr:nucleoside phosphorylase [Bulleidia sp. zg-1006]QRG87144.1 nucleoside phosphorylase [Bulleidia sp. zg-1006]
MITSSYRKNSKPMLEPANLTFQGIEIKNSLATFSWRLIEDLLVKNLIEEIPDVEYACNASMISKIYLFKNSSIGICLFPVAAPVAHAAMLENSAFFHVKNWVVFGSCGGLVPIPSGHLLLITEAYRDEGTSYHYLEPSDFITLTGSSLVQAFYEKHNLPYQTGKIWTTDAFYRETKEEIQEHIVQGCIAVDMEASALQAVSQSYGLKYYPFFYTADSLAGIEYDAGIIGHEGEKDIRIKMTLLAKKFVEEML